MNHDFDNYVNWELDPVQNEDDLLSGGTENLFRQDRGIAGDDEAEEVERLARRRQQLIDHFEYLQRHGFDFKRNC